MKALRRRQQGGFTLIEVIIAFALLALALTLLLGSLSGAARQVRAADEVSHATLHAQSLLAQVGVGEPLQVGRSQGEFSGSGYRWSLEVSPYVDPLRPQRATLDPSALRLLQLRLSVQWGDRPGQQLQWQTLRLATQDINQPEVLQ